MMEKYRLRADSHINAGALFCNADIQVIITRYRIQITATWKGSNRSWY